MQCSSLILSEEPLQVIEDLGDSFGLFLLNCQVKGSIVVPAVFEFCCLLCAADTGRSSDYVALPAKMKSLLRFSCIRCPIFHASLLQGNSL